MAQFTTYNQDPNLAYHCFLNLGINAAVPAVGAPTGVGNNLSTTLQAVLDGDGTASSLSVATNKASIGTGTGHTAGVGTGTSSVVNLGTGSASAISIGTVGASTIAIGSASSTITFLGSVSGLSFASISTANINIDVTARTINTTTSNGTLTLAGNGTGRVLLGQATSLGVQLVADQPIQDSSGLNYLAFTKTGTAVNYFSLTNQATGTGPVLTSTGSDSNVNMTLAAKGTGVFRLTALDTSTPGELRFLEGSTNGTNYTGLKAAASLAANTTFTLPSADASTAGCAVKSNASAVLGFTTSPVITQIAQQVFTASGTYTPTTGMVYCTVRGIGGGGGGGGAAAGGGQGGSGAGGGSGGYSEITLTATTVGASQTVTIGAAGAAGSSGAGGTGGDTSLGTLLVAKGGVGGAVSNNNAGYGTAVGGGGGSGASGTGLIKISGGIGGTSWNLAATDMSGGHGGVGAFGGPGSGGWVGSGTAAVAGTAAAANSGGGGGGGACPASTTAAGGAGGTGLLIVTEHLAV